jgi:hypothetical protein
VVPAVEAAPAVRPEAPQATVELNQRADHRLHTRRHATRVRQPLLETRVARDLDEGVVRQASAWLPGPAAPERINILRGKPTPHAQRGSLLGGPSIPDPQASGRQDEPSSVQR